MRERGRRDAHRCVESDVLGRRGQPLLAADHVRNAHLRRQGMEGGQGRLGVAAPPRRSSLPRVPPRLVVVDDAGEVVRWVAVGLQEDLQQQRRGACSTASVRAAVARNAPGRRWTRLQSGPRRGSRHARQSSRRACAGGRRSGRRQPAARLPLRARGGRRCGRTAWRRRGAAGLRAASRDALRCRSTGTHGPSRRGAPPTASTAEAARTGRTARKPRREKACLGCPQVSALRHAGGHRARAFE